MEDTQHFLDMLAERGIERRWADQTVADPDRIEMQEDGTKHYLKQIIEFENRWLRIVVNESVHPPKRITAFFDRRLGRNR